MSTIRLVGLYALSNTISLCSADVCVDHRHTVDDCTKKAILVLGAPRSGTSVTTGLLSLLGLPLGNNLTKPQSWNPKGDFEDKCVMELNKRLIRTFGYCPRNMTGGPKNLRKHPYYKKAIKEVQQVVYDSFKDADIFGLKHPRCAVLSPLYLDALSGMGYHIQLIILSRNRDDIIRSLNKSEKQKKDPYTPREGKRFVHQFLGPIARYAPDYDHIRIPFQEVTKNTPKTAYRLKRFIPELHEYDECKDTIERFVTRPKMI